MSLLSLFPLVQGANEVVGHLIPLEKTVVLELEEDDAEAEDVVEDEEVAVDDAMEDDVDTAELVVSALIKFIFPKKSIVTLKLRINNSKFFLTLIYITLSF
ncbi:hypothetical protein [Ligilactobacillus salivarius]|uniref:hypothetical protein n=1 Tax=Ligilactobacillus salivarius TaxID=1624 RepID=UPI001E5F1963|nr:hypothetical protein [Ligilactobacillus salivarius]